MQFHNSFSLSRIDVLLEERTFHHTTQGHNQRPDSGNANQNFSFGLRPCPKHTSGWRLMQISVALAPDLPRFPHTGSYDFSYGTAAAVAVGKRETPQGLSKRAQVSRFTSCKSLSHTRRKQNLKQDFVRASNANIRVWMRPRGGVSHGRDAGF